MAVTNKMYGPAITANTKISLKVATNSTNADTITLSVFYHTYTV